MVFPDVHCKTLLGSAEEVSHIVAKQVFDHNATAESHSKKRIFYTPDKEYSHILQEAGAVQLKSS